MSLKTSMTLWNLWTESKISMNYHWLEEAVSPLKIKDNRQISICRYKSIIISSTKTKEKWVYNRLRAIQLIATIEAMSRKSCFLRKKIHLECHSRLMSKSRIRLTTIAQTQSFRMTYSRVTLRHLFFIQLNVLIIQTTKRNKVVKITTATTETCLSPEPTKKTPACQRKISMRRKLN